MAPTRPRAAPRATRVVSIRLRSNVARDSRIWRHIHHEEGAVTARARQGRRAGLRDRARRRSRRRRTSRSHSSIRSRGGAASTGILAQKTHQFYIDAINAAGGINGEKIELLSFDNKVNPQESLIQLKKALDEGARFVVQGNGSAVALAITDAVQKHNERNPGQGSRLPQLRRRRSGADQREVQLLAFPLRRRRRHEDGGDDRRDRARTQKIKTRLPDQPGLLVRQGGRRRGEQDARPRSAPTSRSSATSCIRCRRCNDFSPYVAKIKASGADTVITGNWSNDMVLLIKAGKDAGLKVGVGNVLRRQPGHGDRRSARRASTR